MYIQFSCTSRWWNGVSHYCEASHVADPVKNIEDHEGGYHEDIEWPVIDLTPVEMREHS